MTTSCRVYCLPAFIFLLFCAGCAEPKYAPRRLVFTKNFHGVARIIEDKRVGADIRALKNGEVIFNFPSNGILTVKSLEACNQFREEIVSFDNKQPIHQSDAGEKEKYNRNGELIYDKNDKDIFIFGGGAGVSDKDPRLTIELFIGTKKEYSEYRRKILLHP